MAVLDTQQQRRAIEAMREYLAAPADASGKTYPKAAAERDRARLALIAEKLRPLLDAYLGGRISQPEFKVKIDGTNKQNPL